MFPAPAPLKSGLGQQGGEGGAGCDRGPGSSCPPPKPDGQIDKGWGPRLPRPLGAEEAGQGWGLRLAGGGGSTPSFLFLCATSLPSPLLPDIPWKKPFSVEVNGPAQINGSMWVSLDVNKAPRNWLDAPTCSRETLLALPCLLVPSLSSSRLPPP